MTDRKRREDALRESEAWFRQLAENIQEVFWLADPHLTQIFYVSPEYERVFGRTCQSLYDEPRSFLEAVHPEDRERVHNAALDKAASGSLDETYRIVRPDGTVRHVRDRGLLIRDAAGEPSRFAGLAADITEQVSAEEERARLLRESESRLRLTLDTIPSLVGSALPDGSTEFINQRWIEFLGVPAAGAERVDWSRVIHPEDLPAIQECWGKAVESGEPMEAEARVRRADGQYRWLLFRNVPLHDDERRIVRWYGSATDIEDRKRAEEERAALLERETRARAEAEAALSTLDAIHRISDAALTALKLDDLLGELLRRLRQTLRTDSAQIMLLDEATQTLSARAIDGLAHEQAAAIRFGLGCGVSGRIAAEGRPMIVDDCSQVDLDGVSGAPPEEIRALCRSVMGAPLRTGDKVIGIVAVSTLSARRFTDEELRLLLMVADRVAPAIERGRLLEVVGAERARLEALSHRFLTAQEEERRRVAVELHDELGQILTAVKLNLDALERSIDQDAPRHLATARDSIDTALQKVRDMALGLRPSVLDDLGLVAALRWDLDRLAREADLDARLVADTLPELTPELRIACFRVAQAALTNVLRHARARRVRLSLRIVGDGLDLLVSDDGIGFDVEGARRSAVAGSSIGLLGMAERVTWLGGTFAIRSKPGLGTRVRARFPLDARAPDAASSRAL